MRNYYYWVTEEYNKKLWKKIDLLVQRGKELCEKKKIDWEPEAKRIEFPTRHLHANSSTLQKAKDLLKKKIPRCKAKAPISGNSGYVLPTLESELRCLDLEKTKRAIDKQNMDILNGNTVGPLDEYWYDSDDDMKGDEPDVDDSEDAEYINSIGSLKTIYHSIRGNIHHLKIKFKFCGRVGRCTKHRHDLCRTCTPKGGKMVYRWLCIDGNPNVSYMLSSWQGYIPKIFNHNELPVGEFLCGESKHSRFNIEKSRE